VAITRKPQAAPAVPASVDVDALINKGGSAAGHGKGRAADRSVEPVVLRIPAELLSRIDAAVSARPLKTPRHTWLLEAMIEKLERDTKMSD
jgi:hypothetical protein